MFFSVKLCKYLVYKSVSNKSLKSNYLVKVLSILKLKKIIHKKQNNYNYTNTNNNRSFRKFDSICIVLQFNYIITLLI